MSDLEGNKGEWSEPYALLKLISDGRLHQVDAEMKPSATDFSRIVGAVREDVRAELTDDNMIVFACPGKYGVPGTQVQMARSDVSRLAHDIHQAIKNAPSGNRKFTSPEISSRLKMLGFSQLKNPVPKGLKSIKRDLSLRLRDPYLGITPELGFSVKSQLGTPASLFNASKATNLIFRIRGFDDALMNRINAIRTRTKILDKAKAVMELSQGVEFFRYQSDMFYDNLLRIDYGLPKMLADAVYLHYFEGCGTTEEMLSALSKKEAYRRYGFDFCLIKYKRFLRACALGMDPGKKWNDVDEASGGYVVVLSSGEVIAFYIYNRTLFDQYLVENTQFERPSTSRHEYMSVFKDGEDYFIKLNLQIRFRK